MYKQNFYLGHVWNFGKYLWQIYSDFIAASFSTFLKLWKLFGCGFGEKIFKILDLSFSTQKTAELVLKTFHNSVFGRIKLSNLSLSKVFNLLSTGVRYILSFQWSDFDLKYLATVMPKGQPPKFKTSVKHFPISERDRKCRSLFRHADNNWVVIVELKRKVKYSWYLLLSQLEF